MFSGASGGVTALSPTTWKFENINISRPTKKIQRPNELGAPNGWAIVSDQVTMTATVQIARSSNTDYPAPGQHFNDNFGYGSERFVITDVNNVLAMADYYKANVTLWKDDAGDGSNEAFS